MQAVNTVSTEGVEMRARNARRVAVWAGAAALFCVCGAASAADSGTINFTGMIVAPPFAVALGSQSQTSAARVQTGRAAADGNRVAAVAFAADRNNPPSADVSLTVPGHESDLLAPSFTDGTGHRVARGVGGVYHVGATGGELTISARPGSGLAADAPVMVTTNYN